MKGFRRYSDVIITNKSSTEEFSLHTPPHLTPAALLSVRWISLVFQSHGMWDTLDNTMQIQCKLITESTCQFCKRSRISWSHRKWCWRRSKATGKIGRIWQSETSKQNEEGITEVDRHLKREWFEFKGLREAFEKTVMAYMWCISCLLGSDI